MSVKVSVVVPVYNPGPNMDDLIASVLDQSLPTTEYEAIFVDDGSTDGTGEKLDALAAEHEHIHVEHIPNSGWPGKPRNLGTDMATGEYVLYVDNDDWLGREALERLYAMATADDADIVIGKVVGHGKSVPKSLFKENRSGVTLEWEPLIGLLSPHKLFRKAFLTEHGIRFPEGKRRLEDHVFVMEAFFQTQKISILADYGCYHWVLRSEKGNASWARMEPVSYFGYLREVLDVVERHTEPGSRERERLLAHWYRGKCLWRLDGAVFLRRDEDFNREIYDEVRKVVQERIPPEVDRFLPFKLRIQSKLVRADDLEGIYAMARFEAAIGARVKVAEVNHAPDGTVDLVLEGKLAGGGQKLEYRRDGEKLRWFPPPPMRASLEGASLESTKSVSRGHAHVVLRSVADQTEVVLASTYEIRHDPAGTDRIQPCVVARAKFDPKTASAGQPLPPGEWQLVTTVRIGGFNGTTFTYRSQTKEEGGRTRAAPLTFNVLEDGTIEGAGFIRRHLSGRAPKLAGALRGALRKA
ncbi:MAG: poly(ribitol-phosphate) beta-N-acetylglucosaminyltransferase [Solirubrobacteraceae bacterium]|nr:poly(ribitol-phosphate) beta-N-acetylglucosaminyltransferase [Solirubrobacteraceae bacterium]